MDQLQHQKFQVLALSGGGFRGLYTAIVLQKLEEEIGRPIGQSFDLIAGTSIGGILALAVAYEIPMKNVVELFEEKGKHIFAKKKFRLPFFGNVISSHYDSEPLRHVLISWFGDKIIADLKHPVVIPAINYSTGKINVFKTPHHPNLKQDYKQKIVDVALATSAAPTYFKRHKIDKNEYVDGGLFANNPSLIGLHEADYMFNHPVEDMRILSIGTVSAIQSGDPKFKNSGGYYDWGHGKVTQAAQNIIDIVLSSQQQLMGHIVRQRFLKCPNQLQVIDATPTLNGSKYIGLDEVSLNAIKVLTSTAEQSVKEALGQIEVIRIIEQLALNPRWFNGPYKNTQDSLNRNLGE